MSDFTEHQLVTGIRSLKGAFCTMRHQREIADELSRRGLMRFHEWPSGHWALTDKGRNFLMDFGMSGDRG